MRGRFLPPERNVKMKQTKLLLIVLLFVPLLLLASCKEQTEPPKETETGSVESFLTLVENGEPKFDILYSQKATQNEFKAAKALEKQINERFDVEVSLKDDYNSADRNDQKPIATDTLEICVGKVNRVEYAPVLEALQSEYDWGVVVSGNKVILAAKDDANLVRAVDYLVGLITEDSQEWRLSTNTQQYFLISENELLQSIVSKYPIIYAKDSTTREQKAAHNLADRLARLVADDQWMKIGADGLAESEYEILIGDTNRAESQDCEELGYFDYEILIKGNKILLRAGNSLAMETATAVLEEMIVYNRLEDVRYRVDDSQLNPYALAPESFVPVWSNEITVPDWMTDFDEKLYAITNPTGRLMSMSHRGDMIYYPENSLEGILSAIMLGADVLELDVQLTKDNVLVVLHDYTLTRTTNVLTQKGKNGLPDSVDVKDWTYAELQQLSLLDRNKNKTDYKIPTFYEALMVARDSCFIAIDQKATTYNTEDILEIETALDAVECSIYSMFLSKNTSGGPAQSDSWSYISSYSKQHPEMTKLAENVKKLNTYLSMPGHKIRTRGWVNGKATANPDFESYDAYRETFEQTGITLMYCNHIPLMSQYIAEFFTPDQPPA